MRRFDNGHRPAKDQRTARSERRTLPGSPHGCFGVTEPGAGDDLGVAGVLRLVADESSGG
jgi:alkylation response protein AidB-like acyl-CoA dehydrogenase